MQSPDPYTTEALSAEKARELAELREWLTAVGGDLERLAREHPERFLARAIRLRRRRFKAL